jgi:hypothetical protein
VSINMHLLTLPQEIRDLIWHHVFEGVNARPAKDHSLHLSDGDTYCEPCLALPYPSSTLPLYDIILPLLSCRQVYNEALPFFRHNIILHLHSEPSLQSFIQSKPPALAATLHHLSLTTHLTIDNCLLWHQTLTKLFQRLATSTNAKPSSSSPSLSLQTFTLHHHMNPPSSYEHLQLGIYYMSPLLLLPSVSPIAVNLDFAYRANYVLFSSPFLGEVRCSDALGEHELVLRELLLDASFKAGAALATTEGAVSGRRRFGLDGESWLVDDSDSDSDSDVGGPAEPPAAGTLDEAATGAGAGNPAAADGVTAEQPREDRQRDNGEQIMALALARVARRHERTWLRGLQRARMHLLSPEMREEVERALREVEEGEAEEEGGD